MRVCVCACVRVRACVFVLMYMAGGQCTEAILADTGMVDEVKRLTTLCKQLEQELREASYQNIVLHSFASFALVTPYTSTYMNTRTYTDACISISHKLVCFLSSFLYFCFQSQLSLCKQKQLHEVKIAAIEKHLTLAKNSNQDLEVTSLSLCFFLILSQMLT